VVASVTVTPTTASIQVGATTTLAAQPRAADNSPLNGRAVVWSTSAAAVATVANGVVTAVSPGSAVISATSEGQVGSATITVTTPPPAPVASVVITPATATVQVGGTTTLTAEARAASNAVLTGRTITWSSSAPSVATVASGVVTAVSAGSATITASSEGQNGTAAITVTAPPAPPFSGLVANAFTNCVVRNANRYCWGLGFNGALGNGASSDLIVPTGIVHVPVLASIAGGFLHSCGLTAAGAAWCWGSGNNGALGNNATAIQASPVAVQGGKTFTKLGLSNADWRSCGIEANGDVWCWGHNGAGALGDGTMTDRWVPTKVIALPPAQQVVSGDRFTCALTNAGAAWCWGQNFGGQLGDGTTSNRATPAAVSGGHVFTELTAGFSHACGVRADGMVMCWGTNGQGQLGDATTQNRLVPTLSVAPAMARIRSASATTCGITTGGAAWCWGQNNQGMLGDGTTTLRSTPALVTGGHLFTDLVIGNAHVCATTASALYCWGSNAANQLGLGANALTSYLVPTLVPGIP
jgi:hypothetical protein